MASSSSRVLLLVVAALLPSASIASFSNSSHQDHCQKDGQCLANGATCCSGKTHGTLRCGVSFCEKMCEAVVNAIIKKLSKEGCPEIIGEGDGLCEAIGFGPEDPLADVCAAIVTIGCPIIATKIAEGIKDPKTLCADIGKCKDTGSSCGCLADGACADSTGDCCTKRAHRTSACGADFRCGCLPDGQCAGVDGAKGCCSGTSHHTGNCGSNIRCGAKDSTVVV